MLICIGSLSRFSLSIYPTVSAQSVISTLIYIEDKKEPPVLLQPEVQKK